MSRDVQSNDAGDVVAPRIEDVLLEQARGIKLKIRTHVPASVVVYDPIRQRATVTVQLLQVERVPDLSKPPALMLVPPNPLDGPNATATLAPIILPDIPVAWPRTQAGYVTFPLLPGDTGELHVSDRSMAAWLDAVMGGVPGAPSLSWTHKLADSVFHPGLHSDKTPITPPTDLTATVLEGLALIKLGRNATFSTPKWEIFEAVMDAFANAVPVSMDGGATIHAAFKAAWLIAKPLIPSLKVKIE